MLQTRLRQALLINHEATARLMHYYKTPKHEINGVAERFFRAAATQGKKTSRQNDQGTGVRLPPTVAWDEICNKENRLCFLSDHCLAATFHQRSCLLPVSHSRCGIVDWEIAEPGRLSPSRSSPSVVAPAVSAA
ncbi:hypothetical protein KCU88_g236, partial [Aureobasidium melanogenum]